MTVAAAGLVLSACGSSTVAAKSGTAPSASAAPSPSPTASAPTSAPPTATTGPTTLATGAKSATCVNGWTQAAPGSDFFRQATSALEQNQGGTGYQVAAVRYFAGPLVGGGIGAVYYLDVRDPRLAARVLLVSGAGPSQVAVAPTGTHGFKDGDWTGFRGQEPAATHPPLPGKWAGPQYNAVSGPTPLLSAQLSGCMAGT